LRGWRSQGVRVQIPPTASQLYKLKPLMYKGFFCFITDEKNAVVQLYKLPLLTYC
jgi:hypothetical protein